MTLFILIAASRMGRFSTCAVAAMALGCGACGPSVADNAPALPSKEGRRYADGLCRAIETCGCAQPFDSTADCEAEYRARFDKLLEVGFEVESECFEAWMEEIDADPCGAQTPPPGGSFPCASLQGSKRTGAACEAHLGLVPIGVDVWPLRADECGDGLTCLDARCVQTPNAGVGTSSTLGVGDPCGATQTTRCPWRVMYCDPVDGVCRELKPLAAECSPGECEGCDGDGGESLYCRGATSNDPGTCVSRPRFGEPCEPLGMIACGECGGGAGWCDPATSTCVEGLAPNLCAQLRWQAR